MSKKKERKRKKQPKLQHSHRKLIDQEPVNFLAKAIQLHRAGNIQEAETIYRQILQDDPNHVDALHLLGVIEYQIGENDTAVDLINRAISINSSIPSFHNNLGNALKNQGKLKEAIKCFEQALHIKPDYVEAYNNIGNAFRECGELDLAIGHYKKALQINPNYVEAYNNLGNIYKEQGEFDVATEYYQKAIQLKPNFAEAYHNLANSLKECGKLGVAIEYYQKSVQLKPNFAEAYNNLGSAFKEQGDLDAAIEHYQKAIQLKPNYVEAHNNIGNAFRECGNLEAALEHCQKAIELKPDCAEALNNLGNVLKDYGNLDAAIGYYEKAIEPKPDLAEAYNNLGNAFKEQGKLDTAIKHYKKAIELKPDYADVHYNMSLVLLLKGLYEEGWTEYEWRFRSKEVSLQIGCRPFKQPKWDGSPLNGKTILVCSEQGFGDTIQFIRYLPFVKAQGGYVIFECQRVLIGLLRDFPGIDLLIEESDNGNINVSFDLYISLLSLPGIFGVTLNNISAEPAYLSPNPKLVKEWSNKIDSESFNVGLVWAGNPLNKNDRNRSCTLSAFEALSYIQGMTLFSLQKDDASSEAANPPAGMTIISLGEQLKDFSYTAAVISNLDLVISVDTSVIHLAGALGRPVWAMLPFVPDWRWMLKSNDTPWYPSMRLFRQRKPGDWKPVMESIAEELDKLIKQATCKGKSGRLYEREKDKGTQEKIFVVMPRGINHGWGVCGRYVASELARLADIHYITEPFEAKDIGNRNQYAVLSKCYTPVEQLNGSLDANGSICIDASVIQAIEGISFRPWLKAVKGSKTVGYMFFEDNLLSDEDIRWAKDYYDMIAVGSTWCEKVLKSYDFLKTKTVLQGIDPLLFHPIGPKEKYRDSFVIFSGGKLEFRKGQDIVIRAVKVMQERYKDVFLITSWYNPWPDSLATMSCSSYIKFDIPYNDCRNIIPHIMSINGLDTTRVISLPYISNAHMLKIYRDTDIGLFPNRCEGGTNLVMMEYMASGRPVIASYLTGHKDVLDKKCALLVHGKRIIDIKQNDRVIAKWDDPDLDEIIYQLDWAYHNREVIKTIGEKGAEAMSRFTWMETAQAFYNIMNLKNVI